jgi:hypothetical protein
MPDLNGSLIPSSTAPARVVRGAIIATWVAAFALAPALSAQYAAPYASRFGIAPYAGASIPTGDLRDTFDSAFLLGAEGMYSLGTHFDVLGGFDWTQPSTTLVTTDAHTNVYQADLGVEVGTARGNMKRWAMRPFADIGAGVRHYDYASSELNDRTRPVGFAAIGTELALGRSAIRIAARDNVFSYEAPTVDATRSTRNDVGLTLGVGFHP